MILRLAGILGLAGALAGDACLAQELTFSAPARLTVEVGSDFERVSMPVSPYAGDGPAELVVEGATTTRVWRLAAPSMTPAQIVAPLRRQIEAQGWKVRFECTDAGCGGYDFRYAMDVVDAPAMYVDLGNYQYLLAERRAGGGTHEALSILASRAPQAGFVQVTRVTPASAAQPPLW